MFNNIVDLTPQKLIINHFLKCLSILLLFFCNSTSKNPTNTYRSYYQHITNYLLLRKYKLNKPKKNNKF